MELEDKWRKIKELGQGGQGKVFLVVNKLKEQGIEDQLIEALRNISTPTITVNMRHKHFEKFRKSLVDLIQLEDPKNQGALKTLHKPEDARDADLAEERIKIEIKAMFEAMHPNLLKIIDYDLEDKWFVSEFHPKGTLSDQYNKNKFIGDFIGSLKAFRPLVEAIDYLHKNKLVHRDIKPQNVFLGSNNNLVLGDFGLVIFTDDQHTRISATFENVGSRDWMPPWAVHKKLDEVKPTFDVYSLGKLLWAMITGRILPFWEFEESEYNVVNICPDSPYIYMANELFKKCIVRKEENCLPDASALLAEVDKLLTIVSYKADLLGDDIIRSCKICGIGSYELAGDRKAYDMEKFGVRVPGNSAYKIFSCNHCGNVQLFFFDEGKTPKAWKE